MFVAKYFAEIETLLITVLVAEVLPRAICKPVFVKEGNGKISGLFRRYFHRVAGLKHRGILAGCSDILYSP